MGNVLLDDYKKDPAEGYQRWLEQNPDLVGRQILSQNKLFRISSFKINTKNIILKVFFKKDTSSLAQYLKIFDIFCNAIETSKSINLLPLKLINTKDNKTFIAAARQKIYQTLEEAISSKPSLVYGQKKSIIYQMILAVKTLHEKYNLYHGHIRTSNFLVTSYGYVMLTDFAFYKPLYMFEDTEQGLPQFRLFYGSSYENCTLAPEKIAYQTDFGNRERNPAKIFASYQPSAEQVSKGLLFSLQGKEYEKPKKEQHYANHIQDLKKMDIFSLGCSILQVLRDGKPLLNYEELLKFKKGDLDLGEQIENSTKNLQDGHQIKQILIKMLKKNPNQRSRIDEVWNQWKQIVDENIEILSWYCLSAFSATSFYLPDLRISLFHDIFKFIEKELRNNHHMHGLKVDPPKCFETFQALKIFKSIIKNKIICFEEIPQNSILSHILNFSETEVVIDSEEEIMNEQKDARRQFFVPLKRKGSSLRLSTTATLKLQKVICPPEWNKRLVGLIKPKYKGTKLTLQEEKHNRFQDLIQQYKKTQYIREYRVNQQNRYYEKFVMVCKIIFSCIRGCKYNSSKLIGIELMMVIARQSTDQIRLKFIFPRLLSILDDPHTVVAHYVFNSLIDLFYMFVDPFENQEDTSYYDAFLQMLINHITTVKLRVVLFQRLPEIFSICQWLQVHIKTFSNNPRKKTFNNFITAIKQSYGSYSTIQIRQLMLNIPDQMWVDMFEFFISFLNTQKILGIQKSIRLAQLNIQSQKRMLQIIDNCIESGLEENGLALYYSIKYFTIRKKCDLNIVKKITPMIIHPHLWVKTQTRQYLQMCLNENPPTRMFFLLRQVFQPPFPLQPKDVIDDVLLPKPLAQNDVDFSKKSLQVKKIGLTQKLFLEYLQKHKNNKHFPTTHEHQIQEWNRFLKPFRQNIAQPIQFSNYIRKAIYDLFQANFLYYVGTAKSPFNSSLTPQQKERQYAELHEYFKKYNKFLIEDNIISYEKKNFFSSMLTVVNENFEKLLTRFVKEDTNNKFKIAQGIYLIMEALYRFEQFNIQKTMKLGQYVRKGLEPEKLPKPKGTLVTEIFQHRDIITSLQKIADTYLITGSYDGSFRVFNTKKIQMNITTDSEAVYQIVSDQSDEKVRINSIAAFQSSYSIAVGTNRGHIRIYHIERMPGKGFDLPNRQSTNNNMELLKYSVGGEVQKIITLKNDKQNQCFCFVTAEGNLGIQDIRVKSRTLSCNIGKQRGLPKCLAYSPNSTNVLIGTIDGYLLCYDVRCNIISTILQLSNQQQNISVTGIYPAPQNFANNSYGYIYAVTYPSKHYEFSYFNIYDDKKDFVPLKQYTSADPESIISVPSFHNKTKQENFRLCSNNLTQKMYYKQLPDFNRNFQIIEHLNDPLTLRQSKIRQFWMDRCKHRYNQIYSVYNKKCLPFLQHLPTGILTNLNPCITNPSEYKSNKNLSLLVDKKESKEYTDIEKSALTKQGNTGIHTFLEEQAPNHLTTCQMFPNMVAVGGWDSVIKIYK